LLKAGKILQQLIAEKESTVNIDELKANCYQSINDDLNSPILIAHLFEAVRFIYLIKEGKEKINAKDLEQLKNLYQTFVYDILGLQEEQSDNSEFTSDLIDMILTLRLEAKKNKDFSTADKIRDELTKKGITIKDTKDGFEWEQN
jgi:cysteinyl-tRNA synthetase